MLRYSIGSLGAARSIFDSIKLGEISPALQAHKLVSGRALEVRSAVERAVHTMRCAAALECGTEQLELARQALRQLVAAVGLAMGDSPSTDGFAGSLVRVGSLPGAEAHEHALATLADAQANGEARFEYAAWERLFVWLEAQIDVRGERELSASRWLRRAGVAAAALGAFVWLAAPTNLALGSKVSASSICSLTPDPPLGKDRLFRVVDGRETEQRFAMCTDLEDKPWVAVDLSRPRRVDRVVVYPRNDCCYGEQELPLSVEFSTDNRHFKNVGTLDSPATPAFPWRFETGGRSARYVRITSSAKSKRHIVIGELEVFGS
jgi:hypothetical protein